MQKPGKAKIFGLQEKNLLIFIAIVNKNESFKLNYVS